MNDIKIKTMFTDQNFANPLIARVQIFWRLLSIILEVLSRSHISNNFSRWPCHVCFQHLHIVWHVWQYFSLMVHRYTNNLLFTDTIFTRNVFILLTFSIIIISWCELFKRSSSTISRQGWKFNIHLRKWFKTFLNL